MSPKSIKNDFLSPKSVAPYLPILLLRDRSFLNPEREGQREAYYDIIDYMVKNTTTYDLYMLRGCRGGVGEVSGGCRGGSGGMAYRPERAREREVIISGSGYRLTLTNY